jgi:hypothetical protein
LSGAEGLDMKPQLHGGEFRRKPAQDPGEPFEQDHDIDREIDFGLQPVKQPLDLGAQAIDPLRNRARFGKQGASRPW